MSADDLDQILDGAVNAQALRESGWEKLGFVRNPFPSRAHPIWEVFHNQVAVRDRFKRDLAEVVRDGPTLTLFFTGGNRVGKTHFMQFHRGELTRWSRERGVAMPIALVSAQSGDFGQLYRQLIEQIDESLRVQVGAGLFERPTPLSVVERVAELPPGDLRRALEKIALSDEKDDDEARLLLRKWLRGERLRATERSRLGVSGLVDSIAQMLSALEALVGFLRLHVNIEEGSVPCTGLIIFIDEFELVWRCRRDRRDQFLQSLRAFVDGCPRGVLLCVGMATGLGVGINDVQSSYPALFARLKGAQDIPTLVEIGGVVEAIEYARAFEHHGHKVFRQDLKERSDGSMSIKPRSAPHEPLFTNREIEAFFRSVPGALSGSVTQGDFFDRLHVEAEKLIR